MSEIVEGVYIGSFADAKNKQFLAAQRITHILSAAWELAPAFPTKFEYFHVKMSDKPDFDLHKHLEVAVEFVHAAKEKGGRVLVHCYAGISRSASIVIAYLIKYHGLAFEAAMALCQQKRPQVKPNAGFQTKLGDFEKQLTTVAHSAPARPFLELYLEYEKLVATPQSKSCLSVKSSETAGKSGGISKFASFSKALSFAEDRFGPASDN